jgi:hypothetical protein
MCMYVDCRLCMLHGLSMTVVLDWCAGEW